MKKLSLLSLAAIILAANPIPAPCQSWNVELLGSMFNFWETAEEVAVQGDYAYVYTGDTGFSILNISDPENPSEEGTWITAWSPNDIVISGNYMYVAAGGSGLRVVDISTPVDPRELGWCNLTEEPVGLTVTDGYAYIACCTDFDSSGFGVVDISDLLNPIETSFLSLPMFVYNVAISGDYAYVANSGSGLQVIDISDPFNPYVTGNLPALPYHNFMDVAVSGDYAHIAWSAWGSYGGLLVADISDPYNPFEVDTCWIGAGSAISINESYAYLLSSDLHIIDISDPASPVPIGLYVVTNSIGDFTLLNEYAFITEYFGNGPQDCAFHVVNVTDPYSPTTTGSYVSDGSVDGIVVVNDYAYLCGSSWPATNDPEKFWVIDVSDPASPLEIGSLQTPGEAEDLAVDGNYAYVADGGSGLRVIDISDPANPVEVGSIAPMYNAKAVAVSWNLACVADYGLRVIIVADPANPIEVGYLNISPYTEDVAFSGPYAYLTDNATGLLVISIANPASPVIVGTWTVPLPYEDACGVDVSGDYAYVTTEGGGGSGHLRILDISDPANPSEVGAYSLGWAYGVSVSGEFAYVATYTGLHVINVSDPTNPYEVGYYLIPGSYQDVAVSGDLAYVADLFYFAIFDCADAIADPPLTVALTPEPPTSIPGGGGSFDFNIAVENHTSDPLEFDLWTIIQLPGFGEVEVLNVPDITIAADTTIDRDRTQEVPGSAPPGTYTYYAYVGDYPWHAIDYDSFTFTKGYSDQGGSLGSPSDWPSTGEGFEDLINESEFEIPNDIALLGSYPNPFNPTTTILFSLPDAGKINLSIYDISGRLVAKLANGWRDAGVHEVTFDGSGLVSGVYIYRLIAGQYEANGKMVVMK